MRIAAGLLVIGMAAGLSFESAPDDAPPREPAIYGHVAHVGWVVHDLDAIVSAWRRLGLAGIQDAGVMELPGTYRGRPVTSRIRRATVRFENGEVHWIQPLGGGDDAFTAFLDSHGDGIHHLAFDFPSEARLHEEIESFQRLGVHVVQSGSVETPAGTARFAYLDTAPRGGGITFELQHNPARPAAPPPAPAHASPFGRITQYAFLVRDIQAVSQFYERLGFGPLAIDRNVSLNRVYRGRPGTFEMYLGWGRWADVTFEWIQPLVGPSIYDEHLEKHGEGFHHLAFNVSDMDAALADLQGRGLEVTMSGGWDSNGSRGRFAYLDAERHGGVALEVLWNEPR